MTTPTQRTCVGVVTVCLIGMKVELQVLFPALAC